MFKTIWKLNDLILHLSCWFTNNNGNHKLKDPLIKHTHTIASITKVVNKMIIVKSTIATMYSLVLNWISIYIPENVIYFCVWYSYKTLIIYFPIIYAKPHLEIYRSTFGFSGSSVWNSLPSYTSLYVLQVYSYLHLKVIHQCTNLYIKLTCQQ